MFRIPLKFVLKTPYFHRRLMLDSVGEKDTFGPDPFVFNNPLLSELAYIHLELILILNMPILHYSIATNFALLYFNFCQLCSTILQPVAGTLFILLHKCLPCHKCTDSICSLSLMALKLHQACNTRQICSCVIVI